MFAGLFLEGNAQTWFTNYFHNPDNVPPFMSNWTLFVAELQCNFGLEDELSVAEEDLRKLTMSDKDHATFFTACFRTIIATLNGTWNNHTLCNQYYQKLALHLCTQSVSTGVAIPATLDPLITMVEHFDCAYWADIKVNRAISYLAPVPEKKSAFVAPTLRATTRPSTDATAIGSKSSVPRQPSIKPVATMHLTKEGKLTAEERQHHIELGACFYCGEIGHLTT